MKRLSTWILASVALALAVPALAERQPGGKTRVVTREASTPGEARPCRAQGGRRGLLGAGQHRDPRPGNVLLQDGHRHHEQHRHRRRDRSVQYCYTISSGFAGCTPPTDISLLSFDNFHTDDIVEYLGSLGVIPPDAQASSFGTLLVTFNNVPSDLRVGGHGHGAHLQPRQSGEPAVGHGRHRVSRLALLRIREHHARRHDPRHAAGCRRARARCARTSASRTPT